MNSLKVFLTVLACAGVAFYAQKLWSDWTNSRFKDKLLRSLETLDEIRNHAKIFDKPEIIKVTDTVYLAIGFALANSILIEGPDGLVIVDVTESYEAGLEVLQAFRNITKKRITDIIYTHNHADHCYGAEAFVEDTNHPPSIWAHKLFPKEFQNFIAGPNAAYFARAMRQFGVYLPTVSAGIGLNLRLGKDSMTAAPLYPTNFVEDPVTDLTLAGIDMQILHIPGETNDQIGVWLKKDKIMLCADDIYKAFPNLYAIRGTTNRDLMQWVNSLDIIINLQPEILVPSHTRPIIGKQEILEVLAKYRDAIQYIHDQTLRLSNAGLTPNEIAGKISLPESLSKHPYLQEYYGTTAWSSKSAFHAYLGWFSGDAVELSPLTKQEKSDRMVNLVGVDKLLDAASEALEEKDFQWALELSDLVLVKDSANTKAKDIKIEALTALGSQQTSNNGRNYYLTAALEEATDLVFRTSQKQRAGIVDRWPIASILRNLPVRFNPELCDEKNETLFLELTDPDSVHSMQIRNSVVIVKHETPKDWNIKVSATESLWKDILLKRKSSVVAIATGDLVVDGGVLALKSFFDCFDRND